MSRKLAAALALLIAVALLPIPTLATPVTVLDFTLEDAPHLVSTGRGIRTPKPSPSMAPPLQSPCASPVAQKLW